MKLTQQQHMRWTKQRALQELDFDGPAGALASLVSDLGKHDETRELVEFASMAGMIEAMHGPDRVRKFIEGFAE